MTTEEFGKEVSIVVVKILNGINYFYKNVIWWFITEAIRFFKYVFAFK